jgi:protein tyrosine phosphatase
MIGLRATQIMPGLWLGNIYDAHNRQFLRRNRINVIVNCTRDLPFIKMANIHKYRVPVHDNLKPGEIRSMSALIPNVLPVIRHHHLTGDHILIHCAAGVQRSAIITLSYLYKYYIRNPAKAYRYLRQRRAIVFWPSMNFRQSFVANFGEAPNRRLRLPD